MDIPAKTKPRLFLVDAYALIYRAYYAFINRPLTNSKGENTSAPFGFTRFLLDIREDFEPDYLAIVFDAGTSFREEVFPEYKATREKMPDDLRASLSYIREIVEGFHDPVVELDGYEADDVIGTLALQAADAGLEAVIVSGDKDLYQLVRPGVHLMNPGRGGATGVEAEWVTEETAHEKFGIPAEQVTDYLALVGDSSDNVPGAPGIGPKTAVKLLEKYGSLEAMLQDAENISGKRAREALTEKADQVRLSKKLVTIMTDLDIELDTDALEVREPDADALREVFVKLEFRRLAERFTTTALAAGDGEGEGEVETAYEIVRDAAKVQSLAGRLTEEGRVAVTAVASRADALAGELVGLALASVPDGEEDGDGSGPTWYLPLGHEQAFELTFEGEGSDDVRNLPPLDSDALAPLRALLEGADVAKVGHDLKASALALSRAGVTLRGHEMDVMVASYVLDPGRRAHDLPFLSLELLARKALEWDEVVGTGQKRIPFSEVPQDQARDYVCERVELALRLASRFRTELQESGVEDLFRDMEMPLVPVLTRMELAGIGLDEDFFDGMREKLMRELELIQNDIHSIAGEEFNLNSTIQLREILFEKLDMPVIKRTKTGPSTDASVLEELATQGYDIPRLLMEYRELEKLRSTYVDALPQLVNPRTGRIHTNFNQTVAATGRLSSSEPNLQNIPIRTELGREVRKGFVAAPDTLFLGVDYSQIELRILAHFSGDDAFVTAFREGVDVHKQTASVIFDVPIDQVSGGMRAQAKTVNFATLYGQSAFSLAKQLGITREEAKEFIETYFERFAGVRRYLDEQVEKAKELGYVETLMGRRRYVPELRAKNWNVRQFGERVAQNTPIQGTAADMIKMAMIRVAGALEEMDTGARMLLQVHDELLFEVPEDEVEGVREAVVREMEGAMELEVPVVADWGVGASWYEAKG